MKPKKPILKYIVGVVIIIAVIVGITLIAQGKNASQDASVYQAPVAKSITTGSIGSVSTGGTPLNCFPGSTTPQVKVMSPNGGETFTAGQQITVKWTSCNAPVSQNIRIDVTMSINGGNSVGYSPAQSVPNTGSAIITLPTVSIWNQMVYGNNFKITLTPVNANPGFIMDESDNLFTIAQSSLNVVLVSVNSASNQNPGSNNDTGTFGINFNVTAVGGDAYIPQQSALMYQFDRSGVATVGGNTVFIANNGATTTTYNYKIPNGQTANFTLTGTVSLPGAGTTSLYRMVMTGLKWRSMEYGSVYSLFLTTPFSTPWQSLN